MAEARSFEDPALDLGRALRARGHRDLAAMLLEVVPETGAVRDDEHRALVAERLGRVAAADDVAPDLRATAVHLAGLVTADARTRHGRTGTVWIAWMGEFGEFGDDTDDPAGAEELVPGYAVSWQSDRGHASWCEEGPGFADLLDALAWARERTDAVIVRPAWDEGTHYWAGLGPDPRNLPPLDESRA